MKNQLLKNWLIVFLTIIIIIGSSFRFINNKVDNKVYWRDEVITSLRISGYTLSEVFQKVYDGRIKNAIDLQPYQSPNSEKGVQGTINSLALEDSQHPPLYYVIARLWMRIFGNSPATIRYLSA